MLFETMFFVTSLSVAVTRHADMRGYYIQRRGNTKVKLKPNQIDEQLPSDKEYWDGIAHFKKRDLSPKDAAKVTSIEKDFRRLIAMKGVKYVYKRNMSWRTWRKVSLFNGEDKIVSYRCNNHLRKNTTGCDNCGLWTLEEEMPCPIEIFSVIDQSWICVHDYRQPQDLRDSCPMMIKFNDMPTSCDNPIETIFRFTSEFDASGKYSNVICSGKYYCEVFTSYLLSKQNVTFRIVSSENNVIYSRIMKNNNENYVCFKNCGHYDHELKKVIKYDSDMKTFPSHKNKRDTGSIEEPDIKINLINNEISTPSKERPDEKVYISSKTSIRKEDLVPSLFFFEQTTTGSNCKKIKKQQEFYEEEYNY